MISDAMYSVLDIFLTGFVLGSLLVIAVYVLIVYFRK